MQLIGLFPENFKIKKTEGAWPSVFLINAIVITHLFLHCEPGCLQTWQQQQYVHDSGYSG